MHNSLWKKGLALGIILLFVGAGIYPAIADETISTTSTTTSNIKVEDIEPKDYLYETIIEIAINPDVKDLFSQVEYNLIDSDFDHERVFLQLLFKNPRLLFSMFFTKPHITNEYLDSLYDKGIDLVNILGEDKALDMIESVSINTPESLDEFNNIILNDEVLYNRISTLADMNQELKPDPAFKYRPVICAMLATILLPVLLLFIVADMILILLVPSFLLSPIALIIWSFTYEIISILYPIGIAFKCWK